MPHRGPLITRQPRPPYKRVGNPAKMLKKIAAHFNWTPQTVREVLYKWQKLGLKGL